MKTKELPLIERELLEEPNALQVCTPVEAAGQSSHPSVVHIAAETHNHCITVSVNSEHPFWSIHRDVIS